MEPLDAQLGDPRKFQMALLRGVGLALPHCSGSHQQVHPPAPDFHPKLLSGIANDPVANRLREPTKAPQARQEEAGPDGQMVNIRAAANSCISQRPHFS